MGLIHLPQSKWASGTGRQVILKSDFDKIESGLLELPGVIRPPVLTLVDATAVKVAASADSPARVLLSGFPNLLHPGQFIRTAASPRYREIESQVQMDFDTPAALWGLEQVSQWSAIYALSGDGDTDFTLKAMPYFRVKSQAGQVISLGTLLDPSVGIGYGFAVDELAGYELYFLSGSSQGLRRTLSANNADSGTGGTVTYSGAPLSLAEGDWAIVLPATNFRWLEDLWNDDAGDITGIGNFIGPQGRLLFTATGAWLCTVPRALVVLGGGGQGSSTELGGNSGGLLRQEILTVPGTLYVVTVGAAGVYSGSAAAGSDGGASSLGSLATGPGGTSTGPGNYTGEAAAVGGRNRLAELYGEFCKGGETGLDNAQPGFVYIEWGY